MQIISIDHFDDRTTGKPKAWVTVEEDGQQFTVGPHIAKPRAATPKAKRGGRSGRPASAPMDAQAIIDAAVKAAVAAVKASK